MEGHLGFVVAAYGLTAVLLAGTAAWTLTDYRTQRRRLTEADRRRGEAARR